MKSELSQMSLLKNELKGQEELLQHDQKLFEELEDSYKMDIKNLTT